MSKASNYLKACRDFSELKKKVEDPPSFTSYTGDVVARLTDTGGLDIYSYTLTAGDAMDFGEWLRKLYTDNDIPGGV